MPAIAGTFPNLTAPFFQLMQNIKVIIYLFYFILLYFIPFYFSSFYVIYFYSFYYEFNIICILF